MLTPRDKAKPEPVNCAESEGLKMTDELVQLIEKAKKIQMSPQQIAEQRRSFAYGNTHIENPRVTREMIAELDRQIEAKKPT